MIETIAEQVIITQITPHDKAAGHLDIAVQTIDPSGVLVAPGAFVELGTARALKSPCASSDLLEVSPNRGVLRPQLGREVVTVAVLELVNSTGPLLRVGKRAFAGVVQKRDLVVTYVHILEPGA